MVQGGQAAPRCRLALVWYFPAMWLGGFRRLPAPGGATHQLRPAGQPGSQC